MGEKIAFIGLGAMGGPMAQNIIKKGSKVSVFDIVTEKMDPVVKAGGTPIAPRPIKAIDSLIKISSF